MIVCITEQLPKARGEVNKIVGSTTDLWGKNWGRVPRGIGYKASTRFSEILSALICLAVRNICLSLNFHPRDIRGFIAWPRCCRRCRRRCSNRQQRCLRGEQHSFEDVHNHAGTTPSCGATVSATGGKWILGLGCDFLCMSWQFDRDLANCIWLPLCIYDYIILELMGSTGLSETHKHM